MTVSYFGFPDADPDERWKFWEEHRPHAIALDIETVSLDERHPLGIGIAFSPYESFYISLHPEPPLKALEALKRFISDIRIIKIAHNWVFDMGIFPLIPVIGNVLDKVNIFDTMVAARLLGYQDTSLPFLSFEVGMQTIGMGEIMKVHGCSDNLQLIQKDPDALPTHCAIDTKVTYKLWMEWSKKIQDQFGEYFRVEMEVIPLLMDLSMHGIAIDQQARQDLEDRYSVEVELYRRTVQSYGIDNPGSPQQVGYILAKRGNFLKFTKKKKQLRTAVGDLEFLDDPCAAAVIQFRKKSKFLSTYLMPLKGEDRFYTEYYTETGVGRLNSRNRNIQNIPGANADTGDPGARFMLMPDNRVFTTGDYCLAPSTRILTSDMKWIRIEDSIVGEHLVGIDEYPEGGKGKRRRMRDSVIESKATRILPAYSIKLDNGTTIIASGEHPWYRQEPGYKVYNPWVRTDMLKKGMTLRVCASPWETDTSWLGGYVSGALDSEGWVDQHNGTNTIGFAQNENEEFYTVLSAINNKLGYDKVTVDESHKALRVLVKDMQSCMKLLGIFRPPRLLSRFSFDSREPPYKGTKTTVVSVDPVGEQELVSIQTSTGTYVAEGIFTHNSREHLHILAHMSGDRDMLEVLNNPDPRLSDLHQRTAELMHVDRKIAKVANFAVIYGATAQTLMEQLKTRNKAMCDGLLEKWFRAYPGAADWIIHAQREGVRDGWSLPTLFGRRIKLPEERQDGMRRKAVNYPILGSDGEVIKRAMLLCKRRRLGTPSMAITVHDSITWDGDVEDRIPKEELEMIPGFRIPFEIKQTLRWE